jgi:hypothetical protein
MLLKPLSMPFDSHSPRVSRRRTSFAMLLTGAVVLAILGIVPKPVSAKVHFDPESPAGKEYALPLDQARDEAAGVGKSDGPAGKKAQLFGEGISKQGSNAGPGVSGGSNGSANGNPKGGSRGPGTGNGKRGQAPRQFSAAVVAVSTDTNGYALPSAILWVAAIVALGGLIGLAFRAARRLS